ncbi:helix-turn-helix transcriptional regulator [Streptomyces sp. HSW2009]|uniref:helix-turn-helix domain-containing protein n=1 Tax=Streptomyces sp. HSW2009 TaxID=3142890 RepID=UPI0032EADA93
MHRKDLDPEGSPSARFGLLVRRMRDERGWTQDELGERAGCSGTHISAVETGRRPPTLRFARGLDKAMGTGDLFERHSKAVRHTTLIEGFPACVAHEGRAAEIRLFEIGIIPGLLQTPAYARAIAEGHVRRGAITPEQADDRVAFLDRRQAKIRRPNPPTVMVVMDESCIYRAIGSKEVMSEQLDHLATFATLPNTMLQIAPYSMGELRPFNLPVTLLTLQDRNMVAYAESQAQGHLEREAGLVMATLSDYHQLQAESLSQADSVALINQLRKGAP